MKILMIALFLLSVIGTTRANEKCQSLAQVNAIHQLRDKGSSLLLAYHEMSKAYGLIKEVSELAATPSNKEIICLKLNSIQERIHESFVQLLGNDKQMIETYFRSEMAVLSEQRHMNMFALRKEVVNLAFDCMGSTSLSNNFSESMSSILIKGKNALNYINSNENLGRKAISMVREHFNQNAINCDK